MPVILDWVLLTCLACLSSLTVNSWFTPDSTPLPWIYWVCAGIFSGFYNRRLLAKPRSLAVVLATNLPALALTLSGLFIWQALKGPWWPTALPGLLEMLLYWPLAAIIFCRPPEQHSFSAYWESGLAVVALLGLIGEAKGVQVTALVVWSGLYLGAGLARLALFMRQTIVKLTCAYTRECYGGKSTVLEPDQIRATYRLLNSHHLERKDWDLSLKSNFSALLKKIKGDREETI